MLAANHPAGRLEYACQLAEQLHARGTAVCLLAADALMAEDLDQRLWQQSESSFVPHQQWTQASALDTGTATGAADILLGCDEPPSHCHELLINLADETPLCFSRFERLIEIIDSEAVEAGRARYQFYRERGYQLQTHKIAS